MGPWPVLPVLADLAVRLIAPRDEHFATCMAEALRALARALQMDWAALRCPGHLDGAPPYAESWSVDGRLTALNDAQLAGLLGEAAFADAASPAAEGADVWREALAAHGCAFAAAVPVPLDTPGGRHGVLAFGASTPKHQWSPTVMAQLRIAGAVFGQALRHHEICHQPAGARPSVDAAAAGSRESASVRAAHQDECTREVMQSRIGSGMIVGRSEAMQRVLAQLQQVAKTDSTVLLLGETGTGKELLATQVHELSTRHGRSMVRVNCAAIPGTLIESELFGREKGAFTGALARQIGRFETADHSSIFLDEIGDLPSEVQVKLLRVLEERRIERLGSPRSLAVDVRIIAATHRDLEQRISEGSFREDLFYRLNVFPIRVPALRDRAEDIPLLVWRFVIEFSRVFGKRIDAIAPDSMRALQAYHWPGNIRELKNVVERAMIVASGPRLTVPLPAAAPSTSAVRVRLEDVERDHIRSVLERSRWRIRGAGGAADQLGLRPTTLETRMAKLGLVRPRPA